MDLLKPQSNNKTAVTLCYIFEICAFVLCFLSFILAIVYAVQLTDFWTYIQIMIQGLFYSFAIFGIGRIIDFLSMNKKDDKQE